MELGILTNSLCFAAQKTNISQTQSITCMTTDGKRVLLGSLNGSIRGWNINTGKLEGTFVGHNNLINGMTLLDDGTMISASDDCSLMHWSTRSYDKIKKFNGPEKAVTCCTVIYNKELAANFKVQKERVVFAGCWDGRVYIWDHINSEARRVLLGQPPIKRISVFENKGIPYLASGCNNGAIWVWDLLKFTPLHKIAAHSETVHHLTSHEGLIVSSGKDRKIKIWDNDMNLVHKFELSKENISKFLIFQKRFLVGVVGLKTVEIWGKNKRQAIDKNEAIGIVADMTVLDENTILVAKGYDVSVLKLFNWKMSFLKAMHKFRLETGYPPVIVKQIYEAMVEKKN